MAPTAHSSFSASGSSRLLNCPGSFKLGQDLDDGSRRSTTFSAEGTLAHAVSEVAIATGMSPDKFIGQTRQADGFTFTVDADFAEAISTYVDYVNNLRAMGYIVALENRVDPSVQWPDMPKLDINLFGTSDTVGYHPATRSVEIGDLKFGAGVTVEAEGNTQLRYYGAGAAHEATIRAMCRSAGAPFNGIDTVSMTIIQPRAYHPLGPVRRETLSHQDLRTWARTVLYDGVVRAMTDNGQTLVAGKWCRFCPALAHCTKPREMAMEAAKTAFMNTPVHALPDPNADGAALPEKHISDDVLADLLDKIEIITPWLAALKTLAHTRLEAGRAVSGYKLVPKRGRRQFTEAATEDEIREHLSNAGIPADKYSATSMLSPAQIQRLVGKADYDLHVKPLVVTTSSGSNLASDGDPRKRIERRAARDAFAPENNKKDPI